jgi:hypothetical protein
MSVPLDLYSATPQELFIGLLFCCGFTLTICGVAAAVVLLLTGKKGQRPSDRED